MEMEKFSYFIPRKKGGDVGKAVKQSWGEYVAENPLWIKEDGW
jgi:hypothetical protein